MISPIPLSIATAALRSLDLAIAHADRRTLAEVRARIVELVGRIDARLAGCGDDGRSGR